MSVSCSPDDVSRFDEWDHSFALGASNLTFVPETLQVLVFKLQFRPTLRAVQRIFRQAFVEYGCSTFARDFTTR